MDKKLVVINLFGGPGSGKSTIAAGLFNKLKKRGVECELVTEFAKDKVWEENYKLLSDQLYIFGKQQHKLFRLQGKVDIAITDSPLLLSIIYDKNKSEAFKKLVLEVNSTYDNHTFFVKRNVDYNPAGRYQDEAGAKLIDTDCLNLLKDNNLPYCVVDTINAEEQIITQLENYGVI